MKLQITTTVTGAETANFLLAQAIDSLNKNKKLLDAMMLTKTDLTKVENFRKSLVKAILK